MRGFFYEHELVLTLKLRTISKIFKKKTAFADSLFFLV